MGEGSGFQVSGNAAELYERYAVPYVLGPWAPELVELAALKRGDRVLDLACGTGVVARLAAPRVGPTGHVTGLDLNAGMLAVARTLPPPSGPRSMAVNFIAIVFSVAITLLVLNLLLSQARRAVRIPQRV